VRKPGFERLAEDGEPLRKLHAVETKLHLVVIAAHMDLAEAVLGDAGRLQQRGV
jgi:hypothetical protein